LNVSRYQIFYVVKFGVDLEACNVKGKVSNN